MSLMPFGSPPSPWNKNTYNSSIYLQPKDAGSAGMVIGANPDASISTTFGGISAMFNNSLAGSVGLTFFGTFGYGTSFFPLGGTYIGGNSGGTPSAPTQLSSNYYMGALIFTGFDGTQWATSNSTHTLPGFLGQAIGQPTSGAVDGDYYIGSITTKMLGFRSDTNAVYLNRSNLTATTTIGSAIGTAVTVSGADGGMSLVSGNAADGLSIDSTGSTGNGLTVKAQTNYYTFQYKKSDGSNLLYGQWDTGNFHHHLGGSLYYNIHTYNFVIDGNGNSNIGLIVCNGAELKLDSSISGATPDIRMGGGSYATAGVPLTTGGLYWSSTWAWNGSNGYTISSQHNLEMTQMSATNGDAELRWKNNAAAIVMALGLLNSQTMFANGAAATPSIALYNSNTTGFYRKGSNNLGLSAGGTLIVDWSTTTETYADAYNIAFGTTTGTKIGTGTTQKIGFFNAAPIARPAALTTQLTSITHTAPGTPDYAIQDLTNAGGYGFATKDEGNTVLSVILNLQTRVAELETKLSSAAGLGLIA